MGREDRTSAGLPEPRDCKPRRTRKVIVTVAAIAFPFALMAIIGLGILALLGHQAGSFAANPMAEPRTSHIEANVPEPEDFDRFLKRDLESYFRELTGTNVTVAYELLRDGPSQAGTAYPK